MTSTLVGVALVVVAVSLGGVAPQAAAHDDPESGHDDTAPADDPPITTPPAATAPAAPEKASLRGAVVVTEDQSVAGVSATTRIPVVGECPVMTDSIRRLHLGFFESEPTTTDFEADIARYASGEANLEALADDLASSGRFQNRYGPMTDEDYVRQAYATTLERPPTEADLTHWMSALEGGYPRGSMMLALTESADFTRRTNTERPMSGYLNWYPPGVHWYCGVGGRDDLPIRALVGDLLYADYIFTNRGESTAATRLSTVLDGRPLVAMSASTLPAGFTEYRWDGLFIGADHYGDGIDILAQGRTTWVVAFYPTEVGRQRLGWNLPR